MVSLLGTNDAREVEGRIQAGDAKARLVYETMAYQTAKGVGELATVLEGQVDQIVLTGAVAWSRLFLGWLLPRISFLGKVVVLPGEDELEALSLGALRVLQGEEAAHEYTPELDRLEEAELLRQALLEYESKGEGTAQ